MIRSLGIDSTGEMSGFSHEIGDDVLIATQRTAFCRGVGNMAMMLGLFTSSVDLNPSCPESKVVADAGSLEAQLPGDEGSNFLRVSTFNTHESKGGNAEVIRAINRQHSHIVSLQEVNLDTLAEIEVGTGFKSVLFGYAHDGKGGGYGVAVLTDLPVISKNTYEIEHDKDLERRVMLVTVLDYEGQHIVFASSHLINDDAGFMGAERDTERVIQVTNAMNVLAQPEFEGLPQILAFDWNASKEDLSRMILRYKYKAVTQLLGVDSVETFPWDGSEKDAIYISSEPPGFKPIHLSMWDGNSDHCGETTILQHEHEKSAA